MKNWHRYVRIFAMLLTALPGCSLFSTDPLAPAAWGAPYDFGFSNLTDTDINGVNLFILHRGAEVNIGFAGVLPPSPGILKWGKQGHTVAAPQRIPNTVIMKWITPDKQNHLQEISLKGIVPDMGSFDGTIWFSYANENWHTAVFNKEQTRWRVTHGKGTAPEE